MHATPGRTNYRYVNQSCFLDTHTDKLRDIQVCIIQPNVQVWHSQGAWCIGVFFLLFACDDKKLLPPCLFSINENITGFWWRGWNVQKLPSVLWCSGNRAGETGNIVILLSNSLCQSVCKIYFGSYKTSFLFSLVMLQRLSQWDTESMLTKQTGWCYMMSSREHIECFAGLIYIGLALRQKGLFIKMTMTTFLGLVVK